MINKFPKKKIVYLLSGVVFVSATFVWGAAHLAETKGITKTLNFFAPKAKNIIILVADGGGYNHIEVASFYQYGVSTAQVYEKFPVKFGMSTYAAGQGYNPKLAWSDFYYVTKGPTDSAAAATAMSTGVKTYQGAIGLDPNKAPLTHIFEVAEEKGKASGVITSVPFSHATPAGFLAHNVSRGNYIEIANEMIYKSAVDVIMGCGHPLYSDDNIQHGLTPNYVYVGGKTTWDDLEDGTAGEEGAAVIDANHDGAVDGLDNWKVIFERNEFLGLINDKNPPSRVIGIAQVASTLQQRRKGDAFAAPYVVPLNASVLTLVEMTRAGLNVLSKDPDGFFLMVEGGAVDWAAHANQSGRLIEEQIDFNRAIEAVVQWVEKNSNWHETLVIVTGDHETGYLLGPGSGPGEGNSVWNPLVNNGSGSVPGMEWYSKSHTNSLVAFYAKGRGADLFRSYARNKDPKRGKYIDNTDIAKVVFHLLKVKDKKTSWGIFELYP